jgi:O-antigen ligase
MRWGFWAGAWVYCADALMLLVALLWFVSLVRRRTAVRRGWFYAPVIAYLAACALSAMFSSDPHTSFQKLLVDVYVGGLALLTYNELDSSGMVRYWTWAWLGATAFASAAALLGVAAFYLGIESSLVGGYGSLPPGPYPRVVGTFLNFNMLCNYLSIGVLVALAAKRAGWVRAAIALPIAIAASVAAAFTVSPGLGGLLLGLAFWIWAGERRKRAGAFALLFGIATGAVFFLATLVSPANTGANSVTLPIVHKRLEPSSRLLCWQAAVETVVAHPVLGAGTGLAMPCPAYMDASGDVQHLQDAHNSFLNIAALKGLAGLAAFVAITWFLLHRLPLRLGGTPIEVFRAALAIAVIEAVLYQGLSSSFEHTRHLWILMGALAAVREIPDKNGGTD